MRYVTDEHGVKRKQRDLYHVMTYRGSNGAVVDLEQGWAFKLRDRSLWQHGYPSKFDALTAAAHACGLSGDAMNWEPVESEERAESGGNKP